MILLLNVAYWNPGFTCHQGILTGGPSAQTRENSLLLQEEKQADSLEKELVVTRSQVRMAP